MGLSTALFSLQAVFMDKIIRFAPALEASSSGLFSAVPTKEILNPDLDAIRAIYIGESLKSCVMGKYTYFWMSPIYHFHILSFLKLFVMNLSCCLNYR